MSANLRALTRAVHGAVETVIRIPENAASGAEADRIAGQVLAELSRQPAIRDAVARLDHATNAEPWYQSRVTLGALVALVGGIYSLALDIADGTPPSVDSLTSQLTAILGAATVLYGRWRARKPLGG
ncbi:hypothetical protein LGR54_05035 [Ancylobacter sp. Lp-2]|uniref:hypothetical protein n=1 Tax=Ancylobacter sp. Lp-2 TaxID=2881339 RepID=UPI001E5D7F0C|nr:hypothetical protein [Ancylobacter sp. Lp-2]MCB4767961.1 hypothetical protein [Ancylobacter sp. Lp-2]